MRKTRTCHSPCTTPCNLPPCQKRHPECRPYNPVILSAAKNLLLAGASPTPKNNRSVILSAPLCEVSRHIQRTPYRLQLLRHGYLGLQSRHQHHAVTSPYSTHVFTAKAPSSYRDITVPFTRALPIPDFDPRNRGSGKSSMAEARSPQSRKQKGRCGL